MYWEMTHSTFLGGGADPFQILPKWCVAPPPKSNHTMALRQQFDTSITNFPWSDFKGKTIIRHSEEICNTTQFKFLPILFVALIFNSGFLEFLRCTVLMWNQLELWADQILPQQKSSSVLSAFHVLLDCDKEEGGEEGQGGATPAAAAPSTMTATTTKRMMMMITRRIVEIAMIMQFDWPRCTFTGPFGMLIWGGKGSNGGIGGTSSTERVVQHWHCRQGTQGRPTWQHTVILWID